MFQLNSVVSGNFLLLFYAILNTSSLFSQSFQNIEGQYTVENDSIVDIYDFSNRKLVVKLNINDAFKHQYYYEYKYKINKDNTLNVYLLDITSEALESSNKKKEKRHSYLPDLYSKSGYFYSIWTLEKIEDSNLYIKVVPASIKWPASSGHLSNYYSGFEEYFILKPIINN